MRYKIIGIAMAALMLFCSFAATAADQDNNENRIHQHLTGRQPDAGCSCDGSELCTHLPLVIIDTYGEEIPGIPIPESEIPETGEFNEISNCS